MARLVLLLLLWVAVTVSEGLNLQKRILGGKECGKTERLYHVLLLKKIGTVYYFGCGGSLINDQWILTAAHCWNDTMTMEAFLGVHPGPPVQNQIIRHEIFKETGNNRNHDLMLLKLPNPTNYPHVKLPTKDECKNRPKTLQIAGHGDTTTLPGQQKKAGESPTLQCADVGVVDCSGLHNYMETHYKNQYKEYTYQHWFCGEAPGVDQCHGDSGGGVVHGNTIYGVIVFSSPTACAKPAAYMDVCEQEYLDWITNTITT